MNQTIWELVTADVEKTLIGVTKDRGYANTLQVSREDGLGKGPSPDEANNRVTVLVPADISRRDDSPLSKDDYDQVFWIDCYSFEPNTSELTPDAVNNSIAGDVIKALNIDYGRGTHPTNGGRLAINTRVRFATPMDLQQSQYRGVVLRVECHVRTALDDPFSQ